MHFSSSRIVVQTRLNHEKSDRVPSTVARIVTVITAASLNSVEIYRNFERTVPCPLASVLFLFHQNGSILFAECGIPVRVTAHVAASGGELNRILLHGIVCVVTEDMTNCK